MLDVSRQIVDASVGNGARSVRRRRLGGDRMSLEIYILMPHDQTAHGRTDGGKVLQKTLFPAWGFCFLLTGQRPVVRACVDRVLEA